MPLSLPSLPVDLVEVLSDRLLDLGVDTDPPSCSWLEAVWVGPREARVGRWVLRSDVAEEARRDVRVLELLARINAGPVE